LSSSNFLIQDTSASTPDGWKRYSCRRTGRRNSAPILHHRRGMGGAGGDEGGLPTGAGALGGRVSRRQRGGGVHGGVEEGTELVREEGPHGILSGGIRRGVRRPCACLSGGSGAIQATQARLSPHFHRCTSRDHADDARRAWPGPDIRPSGEEDDSSPARAGAFCRD